MFASSAGEAAVNWHFAQDEFQFLFADRGVDRVEHQLGRTRALLIGETDDGTAHAFLVDLIKIKSLVQIEQPVGTMFTGERPDRVGEFATRRFILSGAGIIAVEIAEIGGESWRVAFAHLQRGNVGARDHH